MSELFHTTEVDGFTIRFYAEPEDESPRGQFQLDDGSDDEELIAKIEDGTYLWFCVKVTASKLGVELATDYLGCCCYDSLESFLTPDGYAADMQNTVLDGYAADMQNTVLDGARTKIAELCAA